jgi:hypothetical protein
MKKLLFAVCALAAISLLAPNAGFAQPDPAVWSNRIGIYTTQDAQSASVTSMGAFSTFSLYMVLCNPTNADETPATVVNGFECTVNFTGPAYFLLNTTLAGAGGLDIDSSVNGFAVGWADPGLPVTNGLVHLVTWQFMLQAPANSSTPFRAYMGPATQPSVPGGYMAINVPTSTTLLRPCLPSSGDFAQMVFAIGETPVAIQSATFGDVKALFR